MTLLSKTPIHSLLTDMTRPLWIVAVVWTMLIGGLLTLNIRQHRQVVQETAVVEAHAHFNKDLAYRSWAASHGGVYVPIDERTVPNPYLSHIAERDIETPSGKKLTLMNPAYISRQLFESYSEQFGISARITSLKPLRPENAPDEWERAALATFEKGQTEVVDFVDINGKPYLRLMQVMKVQEECLKCHATQGYKEGDIRGGIGIALPMASLLAGERQTNKSDSMTLGLVWFLGLGGLFMGGRSLNRRIGERNQAVTELVKSQERHIQAQHIAHLGHWELNLIRNHLEWSEEVFRIFAIDPEKFAATKEAFLEAIHPDDRELVSRKYAESVEKRTSYDLVHRLLMQDGSIKYVHEQGETFYDESGIPQHTLGTVQDITGLKRAEDALNESEKRLVLALEGAELGMWDWDVPTGRVIVNERWAQMLGYSLAEFEPTLQGWKKLLHHEDVKETLHLLTDHLEGRSPIFRAEYRMRASSGAWKWILDTGKIVLRDKEGRPLRVAGIHLDITERRQIGEQLVQQERLAAVGQLAAGIAHDFNNTLTSVLGFAELLRDSPDIPKSAQADLAIIHSSGQRAVHLVRQILDFSRKSMRHPKQLDLVPFMKEVIKFLRCGVPETIHLHLEIDPGDYLVQGDPGQIQQIVTNLALNARDAMPVGGDLLIKLSRLEVAEDVACVLCDHPLEGEWIALTVTDTGCGMKPEVLEHVFEPFFTTKEVGAGTGLGLSQVFGLVKQHNGHVMVSSRPGQGTTFSVYLPPLLASEEEVEQGESAPAIRGRGETVLLVEDEPAVLAVTKSLLLHLGYQVLTANNGREALLVYAEHQDVIALVLSDVVMPDMDGVALFEALTAENPVIKIVLMSGYPLVEDGAELLAKGVVNWFQKPVSEVELSQILSKVLGTSL